MEFGMYIIFNSIVIVHKPYFETQYLSDVLLVLRVVLVCKKRKRVRPDCMRRYLPKY